MIRKLLIIIMGIFLVICAGACNIYPLYLKKMKKLFNFELYEVNLFGTFINLGLWVALPMGWVYDSLGPKISCIIGACFLSGSYFVLHFIMNTSMTSFPLFPLLLLGLFMGQGSALCYTTAVTTNLKNFRFKESSAIVGLLVANMALSPSIFTTYKNEQFKDMHTADYFMTISIFTAILIGICGFVFHNITNVYSADDKEKNYQKHKEKKIIKFLIFINIITLVIYTFGVIFNNIGEDNKFPLVIVYPCLQLFNFVVIILEKLEIFDKMYFKAFIDKMITKQIHDKREAENAQNVENIQNNEQNIVRNDIRTDSQEIIDNKLENNNKQETESVDSHTESNLNKELEISSNNSRKEMLSYMNEDNDKRSQNYDSNKSVSLGLCSDKKESILPAEIRKISLPTSQEDSGIQCGDLTFKQAILSHNILFLFIILFIGVGSAISNLNNIEFILNSILNVPQTLPSSSVKPTETPHTHIIYNFVILYFVFNSFTRIVSGLILDHLIKIGRLYVYLCFITVIGFFSQLFGIFMDKTILLLSISLAGACHGGLMTFTPVFVRNKYGLKNMGKILGFLTSGCALGSLVVSDFIFIIFNYAYKEGDEDCIGMRCFLPAYLMTTVLSVGSMFLSYLLLKNNSKKEVIPDKKPELPQTSTKEQQI
jgi:hypothetical protein